MKQINIDLSNDKWLIGVSGGCDSMALLDICYQQHADIMVAHMNYQMRETADRDMHIVEAYCALRKIPYHRAFPSKECEHNFQDFARKERYAFYYNLICKYHAKGVLVAHHLDDVLETFYMQKQRNTIPEYYGIKDNTIIMDCLVYRPLLSYTKEELEAYCLQHQISFGFDESNASRKYIRNCIRMDKIQSMSYDEKQEELHHIKKLNQQLLKDRCLVQSFYEQWDKSINQLEQLEEQVQLDVLDYFIYDVVHMHVSRKELQEIKKQLHTGNFRRKINHHCLQSSYGYISFVSVSNGYAYVIEQVKMMKTEYFEIRDYGEIIESLTLCEDDFPITIRSAKKEDKIVLRFGTKSVHRWFIDRKISMDEREKWPVVENAQGKIIFVAKIGCDIEHFSNNPTMFVIK